MKKCLALTLAFLLLAVTALPVLAASETAINPRGPFAMVGKIQSIDAATGTFTVKVYNGNYLVRPYRSQIVTINTTATTRYFYKTTAAATATRITFADLKVGEAVSINGSLANGVWTATRITAGASLSCFQ
jgi:hypothetical protein